MSPSRIEPRLRLESRPAPAVAYLEFLVEGQPLGGTGLWASVDELIAPAVAACLRGMIREPERILLSVTAATPPGQRPQEVLYERIALRHEDAVYAFFAYGDEDNRAAELIVEVDPDSLPGIVAMAWEWHSFRGYILTSPSAAFATDLIVRRDHNRRRQRELERSVFVFEDWADGTALQISSTHLGPAQIADRVDLDAVAQALER